jgi:IS1 family transposase
MYRLSNTDRAKILSLLCEGMGVNAVTRVTGASKMTVLKLLADAGQACSDYLDANVRELTTTRVECDEIWSFVGSKEKNTTKEGKIAGNGDAWTWTAIDADSKLMISYLVGSRDAGCAMAFMEDVASRLANRVQLTTDGYRPYLDAVSEAFNNDVDYAQLVKVYGQPADSTDRRRYSPAECSGTIVGKTIGKPNHDLISTSYVERTNLTIRMQNRRFTRLTNAFSKKIDNHIHSFSLFAMHYNYCKIHKTLRVTPAMQSGLTDHVWTHEEVINLIAADEQPKKRGPYKKREKISN